MAHRTTFSLDSDTIDAIRRLAELWGTSQAGVVRSAVRAAVEQSQVRLTPVEALARFRAGAVPMDADQLQHLTAEARAARLEADESRP